MIFTKYYKTFYFILAVVFFIACISGYALWQLYESRAAEISFLDVGQGDAILLSQGSHQVLIDGGSNGVVLLEHLGKYIPFWDRTIEVVIATHPDSDHIGGFPDVLNNYRVDHFFTTQQRKDSETFTVMQKLLLQKAVTVHFTSAGERIIFSQDFFLDVIYPPSADTASITDANDASIAVIVRNGTEKFFLAGDLSKEFEDTLSDTFARDDTITVLKASHHGSHTSTSAYFLERSEPRDVIISAGIDNRYNHPAGEVMERLHDRGLRILRTDQHGTITYRCPPHKQKCLIKTQKPFVQ